MIFKITPEMCAKAGVKTPDEFMCAMADLILTGNSQAADIEKLKAALPAKLATETAAPAKNDMTSAEITTAISAALVENNKVLKADFTTIAAAEASRVATQILGKTGAQAPADAGNAAEGANGVTEAEKIKTLIVSEKFGEAWALSAELKRDFPTAESFAAYKRAEKRGQINLGAARN